MQENKNKYNVKKLLSFIENIENIVGGNGVIDYIAITPDEFSIYINHGISMLLMTEIDKFQSLFVPDAIFFNENNPQLIIANTRLRETTIPDKDIKYFVDFVVFCFD